MGAYGLTPLCFAASYGHEQIARLLLNNGAQVDSQASRARRTALHWAMGGAIDRWSRARKGDYTGVIALLCASGADVNIDADWEGPVLPFLIKSVRSEWTVFARGAIDTLFRYGARPDIVDNEGNTALMIVSRQRNYEAARYLLERGADVHYRSPRTGTDLVEEAMEIPHYQNTMGDLSDAMRDSIVRL